MALPLLPGELWHGFIAKVVLCEMLSKVAAFVDPNSDVEESKTYIQTGKEERRLQLDFCLENHAWHAPILMKLHERN